MKIEPTNGTIPNELSYSERLTEAGIQPSVGTKADSYDNSLAETINGLDKTESIHHRVPWKTREAVRIGDARMDVLVQSTATAGADRLYSASTKHGADNCKRFS